MKRITLSFALVLSLCFLLASCAWMDLGRISEIDDTPPNRPQPDPNLLVRYEGYGDTNTPLFTCEKNWALHWLTIDDTDPLIFIMRPGQDYSVESFSGSFTGSANIYDTGTYYLKLRIDGHWIISIYYQ